MRTALTCHASSESHSRAVSDAVRVGVRLDAGVVPAGPLAAAADSFDAALLDLGRAAYRSRAPPPHPTTALSAAAACQHGPPAAGHCAVAPGYAGVGAARPCVDPRYVRMDVRQGRPAERPGARAHPDGSGSRTGARLRSRRPAPRPYHAGSRRCPDHPCHGFRARSPKTGGGHRRLRSPAPPR